MKRYFPAEIRRRLAPIVLAGGLVLSGKVAHDEVPRDQEVHLLLEGPQRAARSVRVSYAHAGEPVTGVELRFPKGAPARVEHTPSLRPGDYDLAIELGYRDGHVERLARTLQVPSEGAARIGLSKLRP